MASSARHSGWRVGWQRRDLAETRRERGLALAALLAAGPTRNEVAEACFTSLHSLCYGPPGAVTLCERRPPLVDPCEPNPRAQQRHSPVLSGRYKTRGVVYSRRQAEPVSLSRRLGYSESVDESHLFAGHDTSVTVRLRNATPVAGCLLTHEAHALRPGTTRSHEPEALTNTLFAAVRLSAFPLDVASTFPLGKRHIRINPASSRDFELNTRCSAMYSCPPGKR